MLRYFVIASVLVVGTFVGITAYHRYHLPIAVKGGRATMPPHASSSAPPSSHRVQGLRGDAPWALSALPECLVQTQEWKGSLGVVTSHVPRGARAVAPWSVLHYGDCTIFVARGQAVVHRGQDWLRIPPLIRLYTYSSIRSAGIALVRSVCAGARCPAILRVYRAAV